MATIPCAQFFYEALGTIPIRATRSNPDALKNRWGNLVYNMDLSPDASDDDIGNAEGAWTMWDLPVTHSTQIDDERGNDMVCVAILDRVYILDWNRFQDEWDYNVVAPIYRMLKIGPIPHAESTVDGKPYGLSLQKRFREFRFDLKRPPTTAASRYRLSVSEYGNEGGNARTQRFVTRMVNRAKIALKGVAFMVTIEHSANEQFMPFSWTAFWEVIGKFRRSRVAT